ncbi:hypothetical protein M0812_22865 [Anaeramoeba flamelloides]|uniref:Uncharacterized protein n=1 Tax=Anaeramoeba flamelloides TaxID=1746091 RepID=A0AAV7YMK8_9EUKA|nr:hypothetical protein M0812_22865 [Anaeramoeba flamelloides]
MNKKTKGCPFYLDCSSPSNSRSVQFINCIIKDNTAHAGTELKIHACAIVSGPDLQSCDECNKGGNCNPETGSCDCLPGSQLPSPGCEFCQPGRY